VPSLQRYRQTKSNKLFFLNHYCAYHNDSGKSIVCYDEKALGSDNHPNLVTPETKTAKLATEAKETTSKTRFQARELKQLIETAAMKS